MRRLFRFLSCVGILSLLHGCGVSEAANPSMNTYPSPDCDLSKRTTVTTRSFAVPASISEASQSAQLIVEGTVMGTGALDLMEQTHYGGNTSGIIRRHYTIRVDTLYKGESPEMIDVFLIFNTLDAGRCPVTTALIEQAFQPKGYPQFQLDERYLLLLSDFSSTCTTQCYSPHSLVSMIRLGENGTLELMVPADGSLAVGQHFDTNSSALRDQVDEALQQLSSSPSK